MLNICKQVQFLFYHIINSLFTELVGSVHEDNARFHSIEKNQKVANKRKLVRTSSSVNNMYSNFCIYASVFVKYDVFWLSMFANE